MTTRYRAQIEYDGTAYHGFQSQRDQPTIQNELEKAIETVGHQQVRVMGAGRTDSGVHALGQVVAFDLAWRHGPNALGRALNAALPADIAVLAIGPTDRRFHPRYDARRRRYAYHINNLPVRSPIRRLYTWHVGRELDLARMNRAAEAIVGVHDFATFGQPPQGKNTVREVFYAAWRRRQTELIFEIEGTAFLHRMVRSLVGTMKAVGEGTWTVEEFVAALRSRDRGRAAQTAPAQALFLMSVTYDDRESRGQQISLLEENK